MKIGIRTPSLKKSLAARMSVKKKIAPRMPKGMGVLRDPKKAAYNKVYNMTTVSVTDLVKSGSKQNNNQSPSEEIAVNDKASATSGFIITLLFITAIVVLVKFAC